jgi:phage shock protein C
MEKKLYRDERRKTIGGVCAGLADYFGTDVAIVRAIFVLALLLKGVGFLPYIVLWVVLPRRDYTFNDGINTPFGTPGFDPNRGFNPNVDYSVPNPEPGQPFMYTPPKKKSNAGALFGVVLIVLGSIFLIDELNILPDLDFERLWPVILITIGAVFIFSGKKQPWEKDDWKTAEKEDPFKTNTDTIVSEEPAVEKRDDQSNNNPTIL